MDFLQALYFFFSPRLALRAKCRVCLLWLIKRMLCRLAWIVREQRGRNTTQLYMQLHATIDDVTATANQWRHRLWCRVASRFPSHTTTSGSKGQNFRSSSVKNVSCWLFILCEKMLTFGKWRPILLMHLLFNELKYGFYLQYPAYFARMSLWILDKYSSTSFWQRLSTEFYGKKALNIIISPPPAPPSFCA